MSRAGIAIRLHQNIGPRLQCFMAVSVKYWHSHGRRIFNAIHTPTQAKRQLDSLRSVPVSAQARGVYLVLLHAPVQLQQLFQQHPCSYGCKHQVAPRSLNKPLSVTLATLLRQQPPQVLARRSLPTSYQSNPFSAVACNSYHGASAVGQVAWNAISLLSPVQTAHLRSQGLIVLVHIGQPAHGRLC